MSKFECVACGNESPCEVNLGPVWRVPMDISCVLNSINREFAKFKEIKSEEKMSNSKIRKVRIDQLLQFTNGPVWDGDLISKEETKELVKLEYVCSYGGFKILAPKGLRLFVDLDLIRS